MHLHDAASYAPPGYKLERSDHDNGVCKHLFVSAGGPDLVCEVSPKDAAEERDALLAFQTKHTPPEPKRKASRE